MNEPTMTVRQVAWELRLSDSMARKVAQEMGIKVDASGNPRVTRASFDAFIERHTLPATYDIMTPLDPIKMLEAMRHRAAPDGPTGHVYFIEAPSVGLVKIGFASKLRERIKTLQAMSPVPLRLVKAVRGSLALEKALHERFAACRAHSEWFRVEGKVAEFVELLRRRRGVS